MVSDRERSQSNDVDDSKLSCRIETSNQLIESWSTRSRKHEAAPRGHDSELVQWQVSPRLLLLESHSMRLDRGHLGVESMLLLEQTLHSLEPRLPLLALEPLLLESLQQLLEPQLPSLDIQHR